MQNPIVKKLAIVLISLALIFTKNIDARKRNNNCCIGSKTIFLGHSYSEDATLELALNNYQIYHPRVCSDVGTFVHLQASYFHQQSTKPGKLGRYFLPRNKNCVVLAEDGTGDVDSLWIDLISAPGTSYRSNLTLCPKRRVNGGYFNAHFDFSNWVCGLWASIGFAAVNISHCLNLHETKSAAPGTITGISNAYQALNNPSWRFGKLTNCRLNKTGVDDLLLKLGYNYYLCNQDHIGAYLVATAPTGRKRHAAHLFQPFVGSNHGSFGIGINTDNTIYCCENQEWRFMLDFNYRYVFAARECRSFDLCCRGDWSRFMQVVSPEHRSFSMPGINFFTQNVKVTPRGTINFWTALHYAYCNYHFELGYNLWWRQKECISLCAKLPNIGIYDMVGDCQRNPTSAICANVTQSVVGPNQAPSDATFRRLENCDLNRNSAAVPKALTNKVYAAASYQAEPCCIPVMVGLGGSYEFSRCFSALNQWGVFVNTAVSF